MNDNTTPTIPVCQRCGQVHLSVMCANTTPGTFSSKYYFNNFPPSVGGWQMGTTRFMQTRKPRWLTRVLCKWLLEWEWVDQ